MTGTHSHTERIQLTESLKTQLLQQPNTSFLHSSDLQTGKQRVSILAIDPVCTIQSSSQGTVIKFDTEKRSKNTGLQAIDLIDNTIKKTEKSSLPWCPFSTGFIGSISYECCHKIQENSEKFPDIIGGIYDRFIAINHQTHDVFFVSSTLYNRPKISFETLLSQSKKTSEQKKNACTVGPEINHICKQRYHRDVNQILTHIKNGDVYQVNYTTQFDCHFSGDPVMLFKALNKQSPAPYSAYINVGNYHILSASPELFFQKKGQEIMTRPIKGTIQRGSSKAEDFRLKQALIQSEKDKAELTMIVDLERNDLNKICETDSVKVDALRDVETFPQVFHTVSTITGKLKPKISLKQIFEALFPGGSITGAPKRSAIDIIRSLEQQPRGPYTGAIGFISGCGNSTLNIAIRTMYAHNNRLFFHAGGGIVADSSPDKEWEECLIKAKGIFDTLERFKQKEELEKTPTPDTILQRN